MRDLGGRLSGALIAVLAAEKTAQHLLSALFFLVDVPGIGRPDTGSVIRLSFEAMALLNLVLFGAFLIGLVWNFRHSGWAVNLIGGLAALDVLLEIVFHGFFYITVSVVVSTLLIIIILSEKRSGK
jgi:hypothetical protein